MEIQSEQVPVVKKRFCCGAAKRLKEKCLRFHQDESKCIDFILGSCRIMQRTPGVRGAQAQVLRERRTGHHRGSAIVTVIILFAYVQCFLVIFRALRLSILMEAN